MSTFYRRMGLSLLSCCLAACNGNIGSHGPTDPGGGGTAPPITGGGPTNITPGPVTVPPMPVSQTVAFSAVRKVKNLLTGMAPSDADVALVTAQGPAGLQQLIAGWMTSEPYQTALREKMVAFFRNMFQQTGFIPQEDFKLQLLEGGGFDFGGNTRTVGDDAFPRIVQNLQDSFALTAWQLVQEGRPFTDTLTTNRFVMTTALKSLYIQVEMPPDAPTFRATMPNPAWMIDYSGNSIPIEQALATMTFSDEPPALTAATAGGNTPVCRDSGERDLLRHLAPVPAPAGSHRAVPIVGHRDLLRRVRQALLLDRRPHEMGVDHDQAQRGADRSQPGDSALQPPRTA